MILKNCLYFNLFLEHATRIRAHKSKLVYLREIIASFQNKEYWSNHEVFQILIIPIRKKKHLNYLLTQANTSKKRNRTAKLALMVLTYSGTGVPTQLKKMYRKEIEQKKHSKPENNST